MTTAPVTPFPPVGLFAEAAKEGIIQIDFSEHFVKQSFRNRYYLLTASGPLALTIPVKSIGLAKRPTAEMEIAYEKPWKQQHVRAISAAYGNSPFFAFYFPPLQALIEADHGTVGELFENAWLLWLKLLKIEIQTVRLDTYFGASQSHDWRIRGKFPTDFAALHEPQKYLQVFSDRFPFYGNLCIIDLLMNLGPQASHHLLKHSE